MRQNIIVLVVSLLLMLGVSEIALRWLKPEQPKLPQKPRSDWAAVPESVWTEYHPQLGWYHQRNKQSVLKKDAEIDVTIQTNSAGFRGAREYDLQKPAGVTRILVLGDSFVFGFGVQDSEVFTALLEQRHPSWEVLNLGVAGYGFDQMLVAYREIGAKYQADYVIIGVFPEDFWRCTRAFADSGHAKPWFSLSASGQLELHNSPVPKPFELKTNQFPELIDQGLFKKFLRRSALYREVEKGLTRLGRNLGWVDPYMTTEAIQGRAILVELVAEIRKNHAVPVLVVLPPERWMHGERWKSVRKSIHRFAKHENVDIIDPTKEIYEAVKKSSLTDYYIKDDWHWTPRGHEMAASAIEHYL